MVDLLGNARGWVSEKRRAFMTRTVSYRRGSDSVDVLATPGNEPLPLDGETFPGRYFKIDVADLVLDGEETLPALGDRIVETVEGQPVTYEVMAGGTQEYVEDRRAHLVHAFNIDQIGEQVTYYPDGKLQDPRSIRAVLRRQPTDVVPIAGGAEILLLSWRILVPRASLPGFTPREAVDLIELPPQKGDPPHLWKRLRIDRLLGQDHPGFWTLGIER